MGFKSFRLGLEVRRDAPPPAFATAIPQMFEALLDVFAPLDVTYAIDHGDFVRVARVDSLRAFANEPLWCDEELTRDALTRCKPALGTDVVTELYDRFAGLDAKSVYISAEGALLHRAPGTDEPAWYGRWRSQSLHELCTLSFTWKSEEPWRGFELRCPLSGYPFTSVRPLVRGSLADGDPEIAAENRALLFPALAKVRGALGFDREEAAWNHDTADYGPLFPADRKDIWKRWLPLLAASLLFLACKKPAPPPPPMVAIELAMPGASAEQMEHDVVEPVESAIAKIARSIESRITGDHATVRIEVEDIDRAVVDVHRVLPLAEMPAQLDPPVIRKTRRDDAPVLWLALRGRLSPVELAHAVRGEVVPELERLPGVAVVETSGLAERTTIVQLDLDRLDAAGVVMFDVLAALQSTSIDMPAGSLTTGTDRTIRVEGTIHDVSRVGDLVVRQANGVAVRLRDVAVIEDSVERDGTGQPMLAIRAIDPSQASEVVERVRGVIAKLPPGVDVEEVKSPIAKRPRPALVVELRGAKLTDLRTAAEGITTRLAAKGLRDVVRDPPIGEAEESVVPDRERAADLGVPIADVMATLRAIGGARVGPIVVRFPKTSLRSLLDRLRVRDQRGTFVPISAMVSTKVGVSQAILRRNRERTIELSIYAAGAREIVTAYAPPQGVRVTVSP